MSENDAWTPYGLEAIRVARLRRNRVLTIAAILAALILWNVFAPKPVNDQRVDILTQTVNGKQSAGGGLQIEAPDKDKPVTVSLTPGKIVHADGGSTAPKDTINRPPAIAPQPRGAPIPYALYAVNFGIPLGIGALIFLIGKRRKPEINYGIYKGAMPLEMISASASKRIFTGRMARASVFGKTQADHLPPEVQRIAQEGEA